MSLDPTIAARLKRNEAGLFSAVAQERSTGDVLMVAWMDDEALARTLATRKGTYYSRSRQQYWVKGETSGHTQYVHEVRLDCDGDAVLLVVDQEPLSEEIVQRISDLDGVESVEPMSMAKAMIEGAALDIAAVDAAVALVEAGRDDGSSAAGGWGGRLRRLFRR